MATEAQDLLDADGATAIVNTQAREELRVIADEQAALRRVSGSAVGDGVHRGHQGGVATVSC